MSDFADERIVRIALLDPMTTPERSVTIALAHGDLSQQHGLVYMPATEFPIREELRDNDGNVVGWQWGVRRREAGPT